MIPQLSPSIVDTIEIKDRLVGKIAGINLKDIDFEDIEQRKSYIDSIKKLGIVDFSNLYIEGQDKISSDTIDYMQRELNLNINNGYINKVKHLPYMICKIFKALKQDTSQEEILIIGKNSKKVGEIAVKISPHFKFISAYGLHEDEKDTVYDYILDNTGISTFFPTDLKDVIKNYSIIINLSHSILNETIYKKTKKSTIIIDFSNEGIEFNSIQDFSYYIKNLKRSPCFADIIDSVILENFGGEIEDNCIIPKKVISHNKIYDIDEYIGSFVKLKGKF